MAEIILGGAVAVAGGVYLFHKLEAREQQKSTLRLHVHLVGGHELLKKDSGSSDPYVIFKQQHVEFKSDVQEKNLNPTWDTKFDFGINDLKDELIIKVYDHDSITRDDPMGHASIDLSDVPHTPKEFIVQLKGDAGLLHKNHGTLKIILHFEKKEKGHNK